MKFDDLLNISLIKKNTPNLENLKVTLRKKGVKGNSLFATKHIKKGNIIAYYLIKVYSLTKDTGPFGNTYLFTIYTKKGNASNKYTGNLFEGSLPPPRRNIPFWAYFSNEPNMNQQANSYVDNNLKINYKNRNIVKPGDTMIYKLIAARDIKPGEEITWCYGDSYHRNYETMCEDE
jgi:hypothetical protein